MIVSALVHLWVWFFSYGVYHMGANDPEGAKTLVAWGIAGSIITLGIIFVAALVLAWEWLEWALATPVDEKPKQDHERDE